MKMQALRTKAELSTFMWKMRGPQYDENVYTEMTVVLGQE